MTVIEERPFRCACVRIRQQLSHSLRQSDFDQRLLIFRFGEIPVLDLLARLPRHFGGEIGEGVRGIAGQFINASRLPVACQHDCCCLRVVRPRRGRNLAVPRAAKDRAVFECGGEAARVIFGVPAVT